MSRESSLSILAESTAKRYAKSDSSLYFDSLKSTETGRTLSFLSKHNSQRRYVISFGSGFKIDESNLHDILSLNCSDLIIRGPIDDSCVLDLLCMGTRTFNSLKFQLEASTSLINYITKNEITIENIEKVSKKYALGVDEDTFVNFGAFSVGSISRFGGSVDFKKLKLKFVRKIVAKILSDYSGIYIQKEVGKVFLKDYTPASITIKIPDYAKAFLIDNNNSVEEKRNNLEEFVKFMAEIVPPSKDYLGVVDSVESDREFIESIKETGIFIKIDLSLETAYNIELDYGATYSRDEIANSILPDGSIDDTTLKELKTKNNRPVIEFINEGIANNLLMLEACNNLKNVLNKNINYARRYSLHRTDSAAVAVLAIKGDYFLGEEVIQKMIELCDYELVIEASRLRVAAQSSCVFDKVDASTRLALKNSSVNLNKINLFKGISLNIKGADPNSIDSHKMGLLVARVRGNLFWFNLKMGGKHVTHPEITLDFAEFANIKEPIVKTAIEAVGGISIGNEGEVVLKDKKYMDDSRAFEVLDPAAKTNLTEYIDTYKLDVAVNLMFSPHTKMSNKDSMVMYSVLNRITSKIIDSASSHGSEMDKIVFKEKVCNDTYFLNDFSVTCNYGSGWKNTAPIDVGTIDGVPLFKKFRVGDSMHETLKVGKKKLASDGYVCVSIKSSKNERLTANWHTS